MTEAHENQPSPDATGDEADGHCRAPRLVINVVTIFPQFFTTPLGLSIPSRAKEAGSVEYRVIDLREFTHDRHRTVDDYPYGGGAGMVMKPGPFFEAVEALGATSPIVLMSARGRRFSQADAIRFSEGTELTHSLRALQGRRPARRRPSGHGRALARRLRAQRRRAGGARGHRRDRAAAPRRDVRSRQRAQDSFYGRELSAPSYTRPPVFRGHAVPEVLLSGDHKKIDEWREREGRRLSGNRED